MLQSFVSLPVHLVFSTKNRAALIGDDMQSRLREYIGGILREQKSKLVAAGGMPDHIHLLVLLSKQVALADLLRDPKSASSKWIHDTFPRQQDFAWQAGYGVFAVSHSNLPQVTRYIANQAQHHHAQSYQDEFIALLKKHEIEFDARYLWE
jgi:REP element-mobilizing transposase RayT